MWIAVTAQIYSTVIRRRMMRGRTFENAYIIADEMQNATRQQMKMLLTRLGENCKLVVTGDLQQQVIESRPLE